MLFVIQYALSTGQNVSPRRVRLRLRHSGAQRAGMTRRSARSLKNELDTDASALIRSRSKASLKRSHRPRLSRSISRRTLMPEPDGHVHQYAALGRKRHPSTQSEANLPVSVDVQTLDPVTLPQARKSQHSARGPAAFGASRPAATAAAHCLAAYRAAGKFRANTTPIFYRSCSPRRMS